MAKRILVLLIEANLLWVLVQKKKNFNLKKLNFLNLQFVKNILHPIKRKNFQHKILVNLLKKIWHKIWEDLVQNLQFNINFLKKLSLNENLNNKKKNFIMKMS